MAVCRVSLAAVAYGLSSVKRTLAGCQRLARAANVSSPPAHIGQSGHRELALIAKAMPIFCKNSDFLKKNEDYSEKNLNFAHISS